MAQYRRTRYLIKPRLQMMFVLVFLSTASLYVLLQAILLNLTMQRVSQELPTGSEAVMPHVLSALRTNLFLTFAILIPVSLSIGIVVTFRVAGPVHRFETYLKQILSGERPGPCRLRDADELQELCSLINQVTEPLRATPEESADSESTLRAQLDEAPSLVPEQASAAPSEEPV